MSPQTKPKNQAAAIVQMPRDAMSRASELVAGGIYHPPYPWDVPPPAHVPRHVMGSAVAPPYGAANQVEIVNYTVPEGSWFVLKGLLIRYDGANFVQGSGDIVFQLDIDNPQTLGVGGNSALGHAVPDYGQILFNLGSFDFGPIRLWGSPVFYSNQRIGVKGYTVANVATGGRNFFSAWLMGWEWAIAQ
jgi:hypothetical protein